MIDVLLIELVSAMVDDGNMHEYFFADFLIEAYICLK